VTHSQDKAPSPAPPINPVPSQPTAPEAYKPRLVPELKFTSEDRKILAEMQDGVTEDSRSWRLNIDAQALSLKSGFDELLCLPLVRGLRKYDFQIKTALKVLRELRGRAILGDEVGLGKTIEAGLIMKELMIRGLVKKVLILVPASLTEQWRDEMQEKFGVSFEVTDEVEDWARHDRLICSLDTAKRPQHSANVEALTYDLVIVDEAHKLKNRATLNWRYVNGIRRKYILLLTATPVQNDLEELFNLVTLLKPGQLGTWSSFKKRFILAGDKRMPNDVTDLRELLFEVMIRNRRGTVITLPPRKAHLAKIVLSPGERKLYEEVTAFIRSRYPHLDRKQASINRLALMILQKEVGSSSFAAASTLSRLSESEQFTFEEREQLARLKDIAYRVTSHEKGAKLLEFLNKFEDKVVTFTQYLPTLRYLDELLIREGISHVTFHGGMDPWTKEQSIRAFKADKRVLLSTEAGGEGRNLQFANKLVNYDLPWNPLRLEQRIGRIHRVGQEKEVHVVSFWTDDTIDEYILELLDKKINMFELVVGELDLILGNVGDKRSFEEILMDIWTMESEAERRRELEKLGTELIEAKKKYTDVQAYQQSLFGSSLAVEGGA